MKTNYSKIHAESIIKDYLSGIPIYELSKKYKTSKDSITALLKEKNVAIRPRSHKRSILFGKEKEILDLYENGLSCSQIANKFNCSIKPVSNLLKHLEVEIRNPGFYQSKTESTKNGYKIVKCPENYPKKYSNGGTLYYEHILKVESRIGRVLSSNEVVHHINLEKLDNSEDNLIECTVQEHQKIHNQLDDLVCELIKNKLILFDTTNKIYIWNNTTKEKN